MSTGNSIHAINSRMARIKMMEPISSPKCPKRDGPGFVSAIGPVLSAVAIPVSGAASVSGICTAGLGGRARNRVKVACASWIIGQLHKANVPTLDILLYSPVRTLAPEFQLNS